MFHSIIMNHWRFNTTLIISEAINYYEYLLVWCESKRNRKDYDHPCNKYINEKMSSLMDASVEMS